jgi:cell volume regulation protein A
MVDLMLTVTYFGILLGLGIIVANLLKKARVPDTFFLLLLGLLLGPTFYLNPFISQYISVSLVNVNLMGNIPDFLRILALILIVFTSMFNLGLRAFKRVGNIALNLALVGVVFNTLVLGLVLNFIFGFELVYSFVMAAVISGTGTGVIFAFEDSLKGAKRALNVVKVESILNSPLSVLFPILILNLISLSPGNVFEPMRYLSEFWVMVAVGAGVGLILGLSVTRLLHGMLKVYTPLMLFSIALISYALAVNVGGSGMLAVAVAGLIAGNFIRKRDEEIHQFDDHLSEMLRISVFTLLGAQVTLFLGLNEFLAIFMFFIIMFFIRPLFVFPVLGKKKRDFDRKEFLIMSFVTPRGLSAAAIAPIVASSFISMGFPDLASSIMNIVFMVILLSVLFSTVFALGIEREIVSERAHRPKKEKPAEPESPETSIEQGPEPSIQEEETPPSSLYI